MKSVLKILALLFALSIMILIAGVLSRLVVDSLDITNYNVFMLLFGLFMFLLGVGPMKSIFVNILRSE